MSDFSRIPDNDNSAQAAARDSLELGSLASSSVSAPRPSESSSASGPPSSRKLSFDDDDPLTTPRVGTHTRHHRTGSVSSAFDFAAPLFRLSATNGYTSLGGASSLDPTVASEGVSLERNKSLTYLNGLSLVIGLIIGSGIFSSPSQVNKNTGSPGASLIVWTVAGLLAWTGATSYAELGGAIPLNGGAQIYLTKIFGGLTGFLFSWCTVCVLKPGSAALIAIIFGDYVVRAVIGAESSDVSPLYNKTVAIVGVTCVTILNALSTKVAMRVADVFMFFKFLALAAVAVIGIVVAATGFSWKGSANQDWKTHGWFEGTNTNLSNLAVALYAGLWAYDGWDNVNYVTGELVHPSRDLPRVVHTSMPLVIGSYLIANTAYFLVLSLSVNSTSTAIATAMGYEVFGPIGSFVLALAVAGSCIGSLNATTFTSSRLFYAAAREGYLPAIFGSLGIRGSNPKPQSSSRLQRIGPVNKLLSKICSEETIKSLFLTPIPALALNFALTTLYIMLGTFSTLLTFYGVAGYFFYFLTVLGLIVLRVREPHLERPYRCWITTPVIFCCVSLFLLSRSIFAEPWTSLSIVPFLLVGTVIYFWRVKKKPPTSGGGRDGRGSNVESTGWRFWKRWGRS